MPRFNLRNLTPEQVTAYWERARVRDRAGSAVAYAIRTGKLLKPTELKCSSCDKQAQEYHHHKGYDREHWLDVIPMCLGCHSLAHSKIGFMDGL